MKKHIMRLCALLVLVSVCVLLFAFSDCKPDRSLPIEEYNKKMIERIPGYTYKDAIVIANSFILCEKYNSQKSTSFFVSRIESATEIFRESVDSAGEPLNTRYCRLSMENGQVYYIEYAKRKSGGGMVWAVYQGSWEDDDLILGIYMHRCGEQTIVS